MLTGLRDASGVTEEEADRVSGSIPRYFVPKPLTEIPEEIQRYAANGYASVILSPLRGDTEIDLVKLQVDEIVNLEHPLLLFLDRISEVRIDVEVEGEEPLRRRLKRSQKILRKGGSKGRQQISEVSVGNDLKFLLVRQEIEKKRVRVAVEESINRAPTLRRWLDWKGQPCISVAVGLSSDAINDEGLLYNFLPMGDEAASPILGHIDAPFFADIDRRNIDSELPLNSLLMDAAAEACVSAALMIVEKDMDVPARCVFDLIAWTGSDAEKLEKAVESNDRNLSELPVIPIIPTKSGEKWSTLEDVAIWPDAEFAQMKPMEMVKHVGMPLAANELDEPRLERLRELAGRCFGRYNWRLWSRSPTDEQIPVWAEDYARTLVVRGVKPSTWAKFYSDLVMLCDESRVDMTELADAEILIDRNGILRSAGKNDDGGPSGIFVRSESEIGKRKKGGVPMPPSSLTRGIQFLDEKVELSEGILNSFIEADLMRRFSPIVLLSDLGAALGKKPSGKKRMEALDWAFRVWLADGTAMEEAIINAGLHVPTRHGWAPADQSLFSESWTAIGQRLDQFLIEAAEYSEDCRNTAQYLLKSLDEWESKNNLDSKKWTDFLKLIRVCDGLKPIAAEIEKKGSPHRHWEPLFRGGNAEDGMGPEWQRLVEKTSFSQHKNADYVLEGEFWRLAGQKEYHEMPDHLRWKYFELLVDHLKLHGDDYLFARIGRYHRPDTQWDERRVITPLGSFLSSNSWLARDARAENQYEFLKPSECWASENKRQKVPAFIQSLPDDARDLVEREVGIAEVCFGEAIGLQNWVSPDTAPQRLTALADSAESLQLGDMVTFRREYGRAWNELIEAGAELPSGIPLAVHRKGKLERIFGDAHNPTVVIIVPDAQSFEARALSNADRAVLDVGVADIPAVKKKLANLEGVVPSDLGSDSVRLLVDFEEFIPNADDALLVSMDLDWLPEIAAFAVETIGVFGRNILRETIEKRMRAIRVRHCDSIALKVGNEDVSSGNPIEIYAYQDESCPTLILTGRQPLDWKSLAKLAPYISRLVDTRMQSFEVAIHRLGSESVGGLLARPTDEDLAREFNCSMAYIAEMRAGMKIDLGHILHLMAPVVAYNESIDVARQLKEAAQYMTTEIEIRDWLKKHLSAKSPNTDNLIDLCKRSPDRRSIASTLNLRYRKFNRVLRDLGEDIISNEANLRATFKAYLRELKPELRNRLRQLHYDDFRLGRDLSTYSSWRDLDRIEFDEKWVLDLENLDRKTFDKHVESYTAKWKGKMSKAKLPSYERTIKGNRKMVLDFVKEARPILNAWCNRKKVDLPGVWESETDEQVFRPLENSGLLDFVPVEFDSIPALCRRANAWPKSMPETIEPKRLKLEDSAVQEELDRKIQLLQEQDRKRRIVYIAGQELDSGDPSFGATLESILETHIASNDDWLKRSRKRPKLELFDQNRTTRNVKAAEVETSKRSRPASRLSDWQKGAMGMAGERLAFQYLQEKYPGEVDEECWVSRNRACFCVGSDGDDSLGYDFLVERSQYDLLFEVKSTLEDGCEFELTANEMRVASSASGRGRKRYRILYVPYVFDSERWRVIELPNPMDKETKDRFSVVGQGSVRMRFRLG